MKVIVKIIYVFGIVFWSFGLIYSFSNLVALNGLGNIFDVEKAQEVMTEITRDSLDIKISYTYQVNGIEYDDNYTMFVDYFERCNIDTIVVKYNKIFPMVSYIDGVPLKNRKQKTGIILSSLFLLFLVLIWKISNRDTWIKTYREVGNRPLLYPSNNNIKNPWGRFKSRLFKKQ